MELPQHLARTPVYFELDSELAVREIEIDAAVFGTKLVFPHKRDAMTVQYLFQPTLKAVFGSNGVPICLQQFDKSRKRYFRHIPTLRELKDSMGLWGRCRNETSVGAVYDRAFFLESTKCARS